MAFLPIPPEHWTCEHCGGRRNLWCNRDGLRILRCANCELEDILAYLRHAPTVDEVIAEQNARLDFNALDAEFLRQCGIAPPELGNNEQLELFAPIKTRTRRCGRRGIARRGTLW